MTTSSSGEMTDDERMTREELIRELVLVKINEARAKRLRGERSGCGEGYIVYDSKNSNEQRPAYSLNYLTPLQYRERFAPV